MSAVCSKVAPVTTRNLDGNSTMPAVVDFWAIGKNCFQIELDFSRCAQWTQKACLGQVARVTSEGAVSPTPLGGFEGNVRGKAGSIARISLEQ